MFMRRPLDLAVLEPGGAAAVLRARHRAHAGAERRRVAHHRRALAAH